MTMFPASVSSLAPLAAIGKGDSVFSLSGEHAPTPTTYSYYRDVYLEAGA